MKIRGTILLSVAAFATGFVFWQAGAMSPAVADDGALTAATVSMALPAVGGDYEYVGSKKCKMCHIKEYKSWEKTKMAQSFETLKPGQASEAKAKHNLDPAKDYTKDESCLPCHTTGYGHAGGYAIPPAGDDKAAKKAKKLEGIGCESCHGPGSAYIDVFKEIQKSKRMYKVEELYAVGLTKIDSASCTSCHSDKSPTHDASKPFDFEKQKDEDTHEHQPLKQREG
ncbi:MAG: cytochrome c family protein [Phycisphaerae bacterium]|jgi:hypothetical protein